MAQDDDITLLAKSPTSATVGVASAQILARNLNRAGLILVNTSSNSISISFDRAYAPQPAVLNAGITLVSNGGAWTMGQDDTTVEAVNAIASGASSNLSIQEFERP